MPEQEGEQLLPSVCQHAVVGDMQRRRGFRQCEFGAARKPGADPGGILTAAGQQALTQHVRWCRHLHDFDLRKCGARLRQVRTRTADDHGSSCRQPVAHLAADAVGMGVGLPVHREGTGGALCLEFGLRHCNVFFAAGIRGAGHCAPCKCYPRIRWDAIARIVDDAVLAGAGGPDDIDEATVHGGTFYGA